MTRNPFPGPQPYRAEDEHLFCGREDVAAQLAGSMLVQRSVTLYGPSGSGKSSLMAAAILPEVARDGRFVTVIVDQWPADEAETPLFTLLAALRKSLGLTEQPAHEPATTAAVLASLASAGKKPVFIYLDQLEQILLRRSARDATELADALDDLVEYPRELHLVLGIREDYLGRWRERVRGRRRLIENWLRLGPLTVSEMTRAVCEAAGKGEPAQAWSEEKLRRIIAELWKQGDQEAPDPADDDEIEAAHVQIVCKRLFARAAETGVPPRADGFSAKSIFDDYLEESLESLREITPKDKERGKRLEEVARNLLEDQLVLPDKTRRLLTAAEAKLHLRECTPKEIEQLLAILEQKAILRARAQDHQSGRYFELGHDWLAAKLSERKGKRAAAAKQAQETAELVQQERAKQLAAVTAARDRAHGLLLVARAGELVDRNLPEWAPGLLSEVPSPERTDGWTARAIEVLSLRRRFARSTLRGHSQPIQRAAWCAEGHHVVTASWDKTARVWQADGLGHPRVLRGHQKVIDAIAISRDGRRIVTGSRDRRAAIWDLDSAGPKPLFLDGHEGEIVAVALSPDERFVATASKDCTARTWDAQSGALIAVLEGHDDELLGLSFAPAEHTAGAEPILLTFSLDATARVTNVSGALRAVLRGHDKAITCAAWGPTGCVTTGSIDYTVRSWDLASERELVTFMGHEHVITSVSYILRRGGEQLLVSASKDNTARIWNMSSGQLQQTLMGHKDEVIDATFSPSGDLVLTASRDGTARIWSVSNAGAASPPDLTANLLGGDAAAATTVLREHAGGVIAASFDPSGKRVLTASDDGTAKIWVTGGTGVPLVLDGHWQGVVSASTRAEPPRSATLSGDGKTRYWHGDTLLFSHAGQSDARQVLVSPDGASVAVVGDRRAYVLEHYGSKSLERSFAADVVAAAFGPRGLVVVTLTGAGGSERAEARQDVAHVFRLDPATKTWQDPIALDAGRGHVTGACIDLQGERVALALEGCSTRTWDIGGEGPPVDRSWRLEHLSLLAVSADGHRLLAAGGPGSDVAYLLDDARSSDDTPLVFPLHGSEVTAGAFDGDGAYLVTVAGDKARVWRADGKGRPIILAHDATIHAASFSPDRARVITASADGAARCWELSIATLRERLSAIARTDCMPEELRRVYLDETPSEATEAYQRCETEHGRGPRSP